MAATVEPYAARLEVDYPDHLDRLTTLLRLIWIIPIAVIYSLLTATGNQTAVNQYGQQVQTGGGGIAGGLFVATALIVSSGGATRAGGSISRES